MVLDTLHALQIIMLGICAPLFLLLIYSLAKGWKQIPRQSDPDVADVEYRRGYCDGWADGFDYAIETESHTGPLETCSMTPAKDEEPE